jgi:hypothetical protein
MTEFNGGTMYLAAAMNRMQARWSAIGFSSLAEPARRSAPAQAAPPATEAEPDPSGAALSRELARLMRENHRLLDENASLRASAEIWIRMYEAQVERANNAAGTCVARDQSNTDTRGDRDGE